jgi:hypothetical protein
LVGIGKGEAVRNVIKRRLSSVWFSPDINKNPLIRPVEASTLRMAEWEAGWIVSIMVAWVAGGWQWDSAVYDTLTPYFARCIYKNAHSCPA